MPEILPKIDKLNEIKDKYEQSEYILQEWKSLQSFITREKIEYEPALLSVQHGFFFNALQKLKKVRSKELRTEKHIAPIAATQLSTNYKRMRK